MMAFPNGTAGHLFGVFLVFFLLLWGEGCVRGGWPLEGLKVGDPTTW